MNKKPALIILALSLSVIWACATSPVTGRSQLLIIPESQEIALGLKSYKQIIDKAKLCEDPAAVDMVNRVGLRIAKVADKPDYDWEFKVIEDKTANAFALPGGKVAVYTGLFKYTLNETGMAFVIAHEVGHVIARHGGERISQNLLLQIGQQGLNIAIGAESRAAIQAINQAYGIVAGVGVVLPFSRKQEYEADYIGLILMAKAGYDPREAPNFFERMMAEEKKNAPPVFLSTHPADDARIERLKEIIPEALDYYKQ